MEFSIPDEAPEVFHMTVSTRFVRLFAVMAAAALVATASVAAWTSSPEDVQRLLKTHTCPGCDLRNEQLVNLDLAGADLTGADLSGAFMYKTVLREAALKGAKFVGADLGGTDLTGAHDADLKGAQTNQYTKCPDGKAGPCYQ